MRIPRPTGVPRTVRPFHEPVLGLDEAGRGSVLGPLVLGGFLCEAADEERLRALGVRDSKLLTPGRRVALAKELRTFGQAWTLALLPACIDVAVRKHGLNELEADGFARLIRAAKPARVRVDACDVRPARFAETLAARAGFDGPIDARHHADRELPIVGAASILAKVARDAAIARLEAAAGTPLGSGYPSDPRTLSYLRGNLGRPAGADAPMIRWSWATTARVIREQASPRLETFDP